MTQENFYNGIEHIVHISTNISTGCKLCSFSIRNDNFAENVNHFINQHGYKLLHIGAEADVNDEGKTIHHTVAVLGK